MRDLKNKLRIISEQHLTDPAMTMNTTVELQCGETSKPQQCFRWPAHVAKNMADSIHNQVCEALSQTRLAARGDNFHLAQKADIVSVEKVLGAGAFSEVTSVVCQNGRRYACKHLKQSLMKKPDEFRIAASELACEAHMLASFDHPNILKVRGWSHNGIAAFEEGLHNSFFLLLDVLDETLDNRIDRWHMQELISVKDPSLYLQKLHIMSEIASALGYLHSQGVIFRDLKPNNIGFLGNRVQLFDFGLSRELPALDTSVQFEMSGKVGTLRYMANEVAMHQPYNLSADVFSFAMVSYEMLGLQKPYEGWTRDMHSALVCERGLRPDTANCFCPIPLDMRVFLEHAWNGKPSQRPTMDQIIAQLEVFKEQHLSILETQQIQMQVTQHLEAQRRAQQEATARALYIEMAFNMAPALPMKWRRYSSGSIETIDTTSLSSDSIDF